MRAWSAVLTAGCGAGAVGGERGCFHTDNVGYRHLMVIGIGPKLRCRAPFERTLDMIHNLA